MPEKCKSCRPSQIYWRDTDPSETHNIEQWRCGDCGHVSLWHVEPDGSLHPVGKPAPAGHPRSDTLTGLSAHGEKHIEARRNPPPFPDPAQPPPPEQLDPAIEKLRRRPKPRRPLHARRLRR